MSVAIRFERLIPSVISEPVTASPAYRPRFAEAPDCGGHTSEAPESYHGRGSEAPDAGEARMFCHQMESQFSHGRSQN